MKYVSGFIAFASAIICFNDAVYAHSEKSLFRPESHAPAGVMVDHLHQSEEWMLGVRTMSRDFGGLFFGSKEITETDAANAGFSSVASDMKMHMIMLDIMYALNDDVTLMLMPQYMKMEMTMKSISSTMSMGHSHSAHGDHAHEVSGLGDTIFGALIRINQWGNHNIHTTFAISAPTGSVDEKSANGNFTHYGMQLGTGTWDLLPSLTYTGYEKLNSWGSQIGAKFPLESENKSGFSFGERYYVTSWYAYRMTDSLSFSARLEYEKEGDIGGHYNGPHNHSSPPDFQRNYGGEFVDLGIGVNSVFQTGMLSGLRAGIEWINPISEHYNGYQIGRKHGFNISLSQAF